LNGNVRESPLSLELSGLSSYLYFRRYSGRSFDIPGSTPKKGATSPGNDFRLVFIALIRITL